MNKLNKNVVIISGVAGSGKGSVWSVLRNYPDKFGISISYTTRPPREGETDGVEYNFISEQEFDQAVKNNEFLEWEEVHFDKYGTKKADLDAIIAKGLIPVLELDVKGMEHIKKMYDNIISIFITTPTMEDAMERLKKRGTETEATLKKRISRYKMEMAYAKNYDYIIVNGDLERAQKELLNILNNTVLTTKSELKSLYAYGAKKAKKSGITAKNLNKNISECRKLI